MQKAEFKYVGRNANSIKQIPMGTLFIQRQVGMLRNADPAKKECFTINDTLTISSVFNTPNTQSLTAKIIVMIFIAKMLIIFNKMAKIHIKNSQLDVIAL